MRMGELCRALCRGGGDSISVAGAKAYVEGGFREYGPNLVPSCALLSLGHLDRPCRNRATSSSQKALPTQHILKWGSVNSPGRPS